ncbi:hypothetical protein PVAP13_3NG281341, partial [Panicum virgatum]
MNAKRLDYLIVCWNVRGLGTSPKCDDVRDALTSANPHVVCLQETKLRELDPRRHPSFLPPSLDSHLAIPADGSRSGIITAWNSSMFTQQNYVTRRYSLTVTLASKVTDHCFSLTNIYAPADHSLTDSFLHELRELPTHIPDWLLVGDFNL